MSKHTLVAVSLRFSYYFWLSERSCIYLTKKKKTSCLRLSKKRDRQGKRDAKSNKNSRSNHHFSVYYYEKHTFVCSLLDFTVKHIDQFPICLICLIISMLLLFSWCYWNKRRVNSVIINWSSKYFFFFSYCLFLYKILNDESKFTTNFFKSKFKLHSNGIS